MGDVPSVLIIEKARFPAHVPVEECERTGKTADNKAAIIRYQRRADVGVIKQIGRFFSDLFNGVTRAKGLVCDKPDLPAILHIRGERCKVTRDESSSQASVAPLPKGEARDQPAFSALTVEVRELGLPASDPALAHKVFEELRDRFEAHGQETDLIAVENFIELDKKPNFDMTPTHIVKLMHFSNSMARMAGELKQELGTDVLAHVLDRMQCWQDRIAAMTVQGPAGPAPANPDFRFKVLAAFGAARTDTPSTAASPAQARQAPDALPAQIAKPFTRQPPQPLPQPVATPDVPRVSTEASRQPQAPATPEPAPAAPPPAPAAQPPVISNAGASAGAPDASELSSARARLKPAPTQARIATTPPANDDSAAGILARAMAQRRADLKEETDDKPDDDDEWR